jgi:hypothetical protein
MQERFGFMLRFTDENGIPIVEPFRIGLDRSAKIEARGLQSHFEETTLTLQSLPLASDELIFNGTLGSCGCMGCSSQLFGEHLYDCFIAGDGMCDILVYPNQTSSAFQDAWVSHRDTQHPASTVELSVVYNDTGTTVSWLLHCFWLLK